MTRSPKIVVHPAGEDSFVTTVAALQDGAYLSVDEELAVVAASLADGESAVLGGGAAPVFTVMRFSPPLTYSAKKGWHGGDQRTLYAFVDIITGKVTVRPGTAGLSKVCQINVGSNVTVRVASERDVAESPYRDAKGYNPPRGSAGRY